MNEKKQFSIDPESVVDFVINGETTSENPEDAGGEEKVAPPTQDDEQETNDCSNDERKNEGSTAFSEPDAAPASPTREDAGAGEVKVEIEKIRCNIVEVAEAGQKIFSELREIHKLYHNEFAGRLKSMQDELDVYHKADRGQAFDGILAAIARIYSNNETLVDEISDSKTQKHVKYMLLDILDLLEEYGVQRLKSCPGDKRNARHCQVLERIPTDDPTLHDTVVVSHNSGFYMENRTIIKEMIDVYLYERRTNAEAKEEATPVCDAEQTTAEDSI